MNTRPHTPQSCPAVRAAGRRGFFLLEMMIVLALLAVFALIVTQLLMNASRLGWQAEADHDRILRLDAMTRRLRQDVWGAGRVEPADGGIRLTISDSTVMWAVAGNEVTRSVLEGDQLRPTDRWPDLGGRVSFAPAAQGVDLALKDDKGQPREHVHLPSQVLLLLEEGGP